MTAPLLGYRTQRTEPGRPRLKPFEFGGIQVYFEPNRVFTRTESLVLAFQVQGLSDAQRAEARLKYAITRDGQPVKDWSRTLAESADGPFVVETLALAGLVPAHYVVRTALLVADREVVAAGDEFDVTHQAAIPRPWIHSKLMPGSGDPAYDAILGGQLFALGRTAEARTRLERAHARLPEAADVALNLGRVYAAAGENAAVAALLDPFLERTPVPPYEMWILAGEAQLKTGGFQREIDLLDKALNHFGANPVLLNLLGEGFFGLKRPADALAAWTRSLEMDPNQPEVRKKAEALRDKK
jgi:tetratricopeptide (TPR) repeat protein